MDPRKKSLNFIFPTKYVVPKSLSLAIGQASQLLWQIRREILEKLTPLRWRFLTPMTVRLFEKTAHGF